MQNSMHSSPYHVTISNFPEHASHGEERKRSDRENTPRKTQEPEQVEHAEPSCNSASCIDPHGFILSVCASSLNTLCCRCPDVRRSSGGGSSSCSHCQCTTVASKPNKLQQSWFAYSVLSRREIVQVMYAGCDSVQNPHNARTVFI